MTKYILVGGYIHKAEDGGKSFCEELVRGIDKKPIKILDCMFARPKDSWEKKLKEDNDLFSKFIKDFQLELALPEKFTEQVKNSDIIFLRGGYATQLFDALNQDPKWMQELDGKVVVGTGTGAEILSKYYYILDTSEIGKGLGLLPTKFISHWQADFFDEKIESINWDKVYEELKNYEEELPIYTLAEGEYKVID